MAVQTCTWGTTKAGESVTQYTLQNKAGLEVRIINFGCRITHILVPGENGPTDIMLGYDNLAGYEADTLFQGAFVGRYANRIEDSVLELGGKEYPLVANDGSNHLHGVMTNRVFEGEIIGESSISLTYVSPDGEEGFPGELWVGVTYTLTDKNELMMDYQAHSDKDTYVNFTNHSYFNLAGTGSPTLDGHALMMNSSTFLEADQNLLPTGRILPVEGGAFDFTKEKALLQDIDKDDPQLIIAGGYDHCFILDKPQDGRLSGAAALRHAKSGRSLKVYTTQPGMQLYSGNFMDGTPGKSGKPLSKRSGVCLETQHYPASPSHPEFPTTFLAAGEKFHEFTVLRFEW